MHYPASKAVFPLGFGLSYSHFTFDWVNAPEHHYDGRAAAAGGSVIAAGGAAAAGSGTTNKQIVAKAGTSLDRLQMPAVRVLNTGTVKSAITIQGYILGIRLTNGTKSGGSGSSYHEMPAPPQRELFDFDKVLLGPGEAADVVLTMPASVLALATVNGDHVVLQVACLFADVSIIGFDGLVASICSFIILILPIFTPFATAHLL